MRLAALIALLALPLAGCGGGGLGGLVSKPPPTAYNLSAASDFPHHGRRARGQLVVGEPTALAVLDTEKIVVRPSPGETAQLSGVQWEDRLTKLVQARIVQSFENDSRLRAVGKTADKLTADFQLVVDIRAFEISVADGTAVVEFSAKVVRERTGRIMAARVFRASIPTAGTDGPEAAGSLNEAFVKLETELVLWVTRVI